MIVICFIFNSHYLASLFLLENAQNTNFCIFNHSVDDPNQRLLNGRMDQQIDLIFAAMADATRRNILTLLLEDDMAVSDVAEPFAISLAAVSKHLAVLTRAGLISQEKRGRVKWCKLEPDAMRAASIWLQGFGQFDAVDLDQFEQFLKSELPASDF